MFLIPEHPNDVPHPVGKPVPIERVVLVDNVLIVTALLLQQKVVLPELDNISQPEETNLLPTSTI